MGKRVVTVTLEIETDVEVSAAVLVAVVSDSVNADIARLAGSPANIVRGVIGGPDALQRSYIPHRSSMVADPWGAGVAGFELPDAR